MWIVAEGKAIDVLRTMPDASVDAVVTDPPYGLRDIPADLFAQTISKWLAGEREYIPEGKGFMGKSWDEFVPPPAVWDECLRILRPGGMLLCFAGAKTVDLMGLSIRLAGFEVRDSIDWIYGSGFPKSLDVSKAIDKAAGAEREVVGKHKYTHLNKYRKQVSTYGKATQNVDETAPATAEAKQWEGWGTALKPAHEPIIVARKPLTGTVAANVLEHGTGALNIDGCRVGTEVRVNPAAGNKPGGASYNMSVVGMPEDAEARTVEGRWPPNIILTHSPDCADPGPCAPGCPVAEMDGQSGTLKSPKVYRYQGKPETERAAYGKGLGYGRHEAEYGDSGGASRFFPCFKYQAKAPKKERPVVEGVPSHPTVKPVALMQWLVRLVTPPGGVVLDPFAGTGTTAEACELEGFVSVSIEQDHNSIILFNKRMEKYEDSGE